MFLRFESKTITTKMLQAFPSVRRCAKHVNLEFEKDASQIAPGLAAKSSRHLKIVVFCNLLNQITTSFNVGSLKAMLIKTTRVLQRTAPRK